MLDWINASIEALKAQPEWLLALLFLVAFVEALALVGVVIPGIVILFALSMAIGLEPSLFFSAWIAASLGALVGDTLSFQLGRVWKPTKQGDLFDRAQDLFARHGGKSIFIGRFIGPVRPVIPLMGGMLGLNWRTFATYAIPACVLWAPVYLLPGMVFGASLEMAAAVASRLAFVMVLLVMGTWFGLWLVRVVYAMTAKRSSWWLKRWAQWAHRHPVMGRWFSDLLKPGSREVIAIAFLGLVLSASLIVLTALLVAAPSLMPQWSEPFHPATWATSLRNPWADPVLAALSLSGDAQVIGWLGGVMMVVFLITKRYVAAGHWVIAVAGVYLLASVIDALMAWLVLSPPPATAAHPTFTELPHRGFALLVTTFGFFALMVAKDLSARARKWPYLLVTLVLVPLGFAHFYFELASLLGLATATALGLGWSALLGIGYRHRAKVGPFKLRWAGVFVLCWLVLAINQIDRQLATRLASSQIPLTARTLGMDDWMSSGWQDLPQTRSVLGPELEQHLDFQIAGELSQIRSALLSLGWTAVPSLTWTGVMEGLAQTPAHWPRSLNGRREVLLLENVVAQPKATWVIRLWDSGVQVVDEANEQPQPVWLGQIRAVEISKGMIGLRRWIDVVDQRPFAHLLETLQAFTLVPIHRHAAVPNASDAPDVPPDP